MKRIIAILIFMLQLLPVIAQTKDDIRIGFALQTNVYSRLSANTGSLQLQIPIGDKGFMLNYEIGGGMTDDYQPVMILNGGPALVVYSFANYPLWGSFDVDELFALFLCPRGISYAFNYQRSIEFQLNVNPLNFDYIRKNPATNRRTYQSFSGDFGIALYKSFNQSYFLKPFAGVKVLYGSRRLGWQAGFTVGLIR
jgi:hypothetical protein